MEYKFQIGDLVIVKGSKIIKPGRIIDLKYSDAAIVGWKIRSHNLNLITTRKVKLHSLELYIEPKPTIRAIFKALFRIK